MSLRSTQYDPRDRTFSNVGSRIKKLYSPVFDENGHMNLEETGSENLYDYIQSFKESCDVNAILRRFVNGDASALSQRQGMYGDFTAFPKTYAEMLNVVIAGEEQFKALPLEVRERFNHSFTEYVAAMDKPDFFERLTGKPASSEEKLVDKEEKEMVE